jgi:hypothetical protein
MNPQPTARGHDQSLHIGSTGTVINHLHGGLTLARGRADPDQLKTVYLLDVSELLRLTAATGMTVIPRSTGEPRAYVLAATPEVDRWVAAQIDTGRPLWLTARPAEAATPEVAAGHEDQRQDASPEEAP